MAMCLCGWVVILLKCNTPRLPGFQVALRILRNESAANADKMDVPFDRKRKRQGPKDFIVRHNIKKITPKMVAYAAIQVRLPIHLVFMPTISSTVVLWAVVHGVLEGYGWVV